MVSSIGSSTASSLAQRPDPSQMVDKMFAKIDTTGKGFIDKSDLQAAFAQTSSSGTASSAASVDDVFKKLDSNGDEKITKQEMSDGIKKLSDELNSQYNDMRTSSKGGKPPAGGGAPPSGNGSASQSSSSSTKTYDPADADQDGKVSAKELIAYESDQAAKSTAESTSQSNDASVMKRIMQLAHLYGNIDQPSGQSASASTLSATA